MEREQVQPERLIDLGAVSEKTLGKEGRYVDFIGMMEQWGISKD